MTTCTVRTSTLQSPDAQPRSPIISRRENLSLNFTFFFPQSKHESQHHQHKKKTFPKSLFLFSLQAAWFFFFFAQQPQSKADSKSPEPLITASAMSLSPAARWAICHFQRANKSRAQSRRRWNLLHTSPGRHYCDNGLGLFEQKGGRGGEGEEQISLVQTQFTVRGHFTWFPRKNWN